MKIDPSEINKILLIKPRGIGDIVLSTIVLDNLFNSFPTVEIHYLVEEFAYQAVSGNPSVKKVLTIKKKELILSTIIRIRAEKYDMVFDLWSNPRSAQLTFFSGSSYKVGYSYRGRKYAYNFKAKPGRGNRHSAEHNLELLKAIDVPIITKSIQYFIGEDEREKAESILNNLNLLEKNIVGIIPSGGWESKRCDAVKWIEIINALMDRFDVSVLIIWGPGDKKDVDRIKTKLKENVTIAPETKVNEMAALIGRCDLIIANDSGPMHIAAALNVPTLGLFGPTDPEKHGPYSTNSDYIIKEDLDCKICNKLVCPIDHECMINLPVELILEKSAQLFNK